MVIMTVSSRAAARDLACGPRGQPTIDADKIPRCRFPLLGMTNARDDKVLSTLQLGALRGACDARNTSTVLEDAHEGPSTELVGRHARHADGLVLRQRTAVDGAEEEVEQALAGCRVVEHVADERRLSRALHEVAKASALLFETRQEERVDGRIACHELRRMQIPPLIEYRLERMPHVVVVHPPS